MGMRAILCLASFAYVISYPSLLDCNRALAVGESYMGAVSTISTLQKLVLKNSSGDVRTDNSLYVANEVLTYEYTVTGQQYIMEVSGGATIESGICSGKNRIVNSRSGSIIMPESGDISIRLAFASGYGTVSMIQFALSSPGGTPVAEFTVNSEYPSNTSVDIVIGLIVGVGGFLLLLGCCYLYLDLWQQKKLPDMSQYPKTFGVLAFLFAAASLIIVCVWDTTRHYTFMVGGLFFGQVIAISAWGFFSNHKRAKVVHILFQTIAIAMMIVGLVDIVKTKNKEKLPNLTTMHSWLGVAAVSILGVNYLMGLGMGLLTQHSPDSILHKAFPLVTIHRTIGLIAFGLTVLAIETGIMNVTGRGGCYYTTYDGTQGVDVNPAANYPNLPEDCRLVNGMGITVLLAAIMVYIAVATRHDRGYITAHPNDYKDNEVHNVDDDEERVVVAESGD
jgi:hypothetical protein